MGQTKRSSRRQAVAEPGVAVKGTPREMLSKALARTTLARKTSWGTFREMVMVERLRVRGGVEVFWASQSESILQHGFNGLHLSTLTEGVSLLEKALHNRKNGAKTAVCVLE